ncbi:hypothetical protein FOA52_015739 [Chlamydomonas sp. UWO 241]|nr:hypothetical protein FOA52_015739 [Chlamydomonas sp. UWO 241]
MPVNARPLQLSAALLCCTPRLPSHADVAHELDAFARNSRAATQQGAQQRRMGKIAAAAAAAQQRHDAAAEALVLLEHEVVLLLWRAADAECAAAQESAAEERLDACVQRLVAAAECRADAERAAAAAAVGRLAAACAAAETQHQAAVSAAAAAERLAVERVEAERLERLAAVRLAVERLAVVRFVVKHLERLDAERAERLAAERMETERLERLAVKREAECSVAEAPAKHLEALASVCLPLTLISPRSDEQAADVAPAKHLQALASVCLPSTLSSPRPDEQAVDVALGKRQLAEHTVSSVSGSSRHSPTAHASLGSSYGGSDPPTASDAPVTADGDENGTATTATANDTAAEWTQCDFDRALQESELCFISNTHLRDFICVGQGAQGMAIACSMQLEESGPELHLVFKCGWFLDSESSEDENMARTRLLLSEALVMRRVERHNVMPGVPSSDCVLRVLGLVESSDPGTGHPVVWADEEGRQHIRWLLGFVTQRMACDMHMLLTERPSSCCADEMLLLMRDYAAGIDAMHVLGITHNDGKLQNLLVDLNASGRPVCLKVADLGLARDVGLEVIGGMGTRNYRSPEMEVARGSKIKVGLPGDVYIMGQSLLEMWTAGTSAYGLGGHRDALLFRWLFGVDERMHCLEFVDETMSWALAQLPGELPTLIYHCLSLNPAQRPAVREVLQELTRLVALQAQPQQSLQQQLQQQMQQQAQQQPRQPAASPQWQERGRRDQLVQLQQEAQARAMAAALAEGAEDLRRQACILVALQGEKERLRAAVSAAAAAEELEEMEEDKKRQAERQKWLAPTLVPQGRVW